MKKTITLSSGFKVRVTKTLDGRVFLEHLPPRARKWLDSSFSGLKDDPKVIALVNEVK